MSTNRFEVYEYMQPLEKDMATGEFITKRITLASETQSPLDLPRHTLWAKIPGGYWEYKNPWTKKALNLIIGIQRDLDDGKEVSRVPNWHHCPQCNKWTEMWGDLCSACEFD